MSTAKHVTLKSYDDQYFDVEEDAAMLSLTIKNLIDDNCVQNAIPLPNVSGQILAKVIEYCRRHVKAAADANVAANANVASNANVAADAVGPSNKNVSSSEESIKDFDANFVKVDQSTLFELIMAANYLNIQSLLDLTCQAVADMIKDKTVEEIRKTFNIVNDFTPEEEAAIRRENQWAFE